MRISLIIAIWIGCGLISAGADNASFRGRYANLYRDAAWARHQGAKSIGGNLIFGPIGLLLSPFTTGFYQYGWTLNCGPVRLP